MTRRAADVARKAAAAAAVNGADRVPNCAMVQCSRFYRIAGRNATIAISAGWSDTWDRTLPYLLVLPNAIDCGFPSIRVVYAYRSLSPEQLCLPNSLSSSSLPPHLTFTNEHTSNSA